MNSEDTLIIMREHIARTPESVCPFAKHVATTAEILLVSAFDESVLDLVEDFIARDKPLLIIACETLDNPESLENLCEYINKTYPSIIGFTSYPNHPYLTRRDPVPNLQLNTRKALATARSRKENK